MAWKETTKIAKHGQVHRIVEYACVMDDALVGSLYSRFESTLMSKHYLDLVSFKGLKQNISLVDIDLVNI